MAVVGAAPIRVIVADDHRAMRHFLVDLLDAADVTECVGAVADGSQAVRLARRSSADVVLMDINMPVMDGYEAARRIRAEQIPARVLMLTAIEDVEATIRSTQVGAHGLILKSADMDAVIVAIQGVMKGIRIFSQSAMELIFGSGQRGSGTIHLTPREAEVLQALCDGDDTTAQLTARFSLSETTVKKHIGSLMRKLGARSRTEIVLRGVQEGLATLPGQKYWPVP